MTKVNFIRPNRFQNHTNIGARNNVAYADTALVEMFINIIFINNHIVNNMLFMKCFILMLKH